MAPTANCPTCGAQLALTSTGALDAWVCPAGHGLAATLSELYERAQEDDIRALWQVARKATAVEGARACPMCARPMVAISSPVDADEVPEGEDGDGPTAAEVPLDVCVADEVIWFDAGELEAMPADLPDAEPSAQELAALAQIRAQFAQAYGEALRESNGLPPTPPGAAAFPAAPVPAAPVDVPH
ncbi:MAG: hypothetical protein U0P45_02445 [Acidimicrobiales bacterium]